MMIHMNQDQEQLVKAGEAAEFQNRLGCTPASSVVPLSVAFAPVAVSLDIGDGWIVLLIVGSLIIIVLLLIVTLLVALLSRR